MKSRIRFLIIFLGLAVVACSGRSENSSGSSAAGAATGTPKVEIAFLNHSPVLTALTDVDTLLASYGDKVVVTRYDLDTNKGAQFATSRRLTGHVPIAIFINGSMEIKLKDRSVKFFSFPQGKGTFMVASGSWTVEDLRQAIDQALNRAK
jgi:ABC-type glycerol-3-phosphate transport system substrate-binding protein